MDRLAITNELSGAILVDKVVDIDLFRADARGYIFSRVDIEILDSVSLLVVDNEVDCVNLCLPYYSGLEGLESSGAEAVDMTDLEGISGGEIILILLFTAGYAGLVGWAVDRYTSHGTGKYTSNGYATK